MKATCRTCKYKQRWVNAFSNKVTQRCAKQRIKGQTLNKIIKCKDEACVLYNKR